VDRFKLLCGNCYNKDITIEKTQTLIKYGCEVCGNKEDVERDVVKMNEKTIGQVGEGMYLKEFKVSETGDLQGTSFTSKLDEAYPLSIEDKEKLSPFSFIKFKLVKLVIVDESENQL